MDKDRVLSLHNTYIPNTHQFLETYIYFEKTTYTQIFQMWFWQDFKVNESARDIVGIYITFNPFIMLGIFSWWGRREWLRESWEVYYNINLHCLSQYGYVGVLYIWHKIQLLENFTCMSLLESVCLLWRFRSGVIHTIPLEIYQDRSQL